MSWSPPGTRRALLVTMMSGSSIVWMQVGFDFDCDIFDKGIAVRESLSSSWSHGRSDCRSPMGLTQLWSLCICPPSTAGMQAGSRKHHRQPPLL